MISSDRYGGRALWSVFLVLIINLSKVTCGLAGAQSTVSYGP